MFADIPNRQKRLRWFARIFNKRNNKWFSAMEQGGISAGNFLISLMLLNHAGIAELGEYGFWYAISEFTTMFVSGFAITQMVLYVADSAVARQRLVMTITLIIVFFIQIFTATIVWWVVALRSPVELVLSLATPVITYAAAYNLAELNRQYLYMRGRQRLSLIFAACSTTVSLLLFAFTLLTVQPTSVIGLAFWCLAIGQLMYVFLCALSARFWRHIVLPSQQQFVETLKFYWSHGRLAAMGMVVTWAQNKSVNPMIVLTIDTVAAGFYQIARMVFMPVNIIVSGISRSAFADVRRAWGNGDEQSLDKIIESQIKITMLFVAFYLLVVSLFYTAIVLLEVKLIPTQLTLVFIASALVVILTNYRYWMSHRLVVQLQFTYLLKIGCVAAIITLLWMLLTGSFLQSAALVVLGSAIGELYMLMKLRWHRKNVKF